MSIRPAITSQAARSGVPAPVGVRGVHIVPPLKVAMPPPRPHPRALHATRFHQYSAPQPPPPPPPASSPVPTGADESGLQIVWDGPHPRLRRKLRVSTMAPMADFELASSRALNTAKRLGLPALLGARSDGDGEWATGRRGIHTPSTGPVSARSTEAAAARLAVPRGGGGGAGSSESERRAHVEKLAALTYLAPVGTEDLLEAAQARMREARGLLAGGGRAPPVPSQQLASTWHNPASAVDMARLHMQPPVGLEDVIRSQLQPEGEAAVEHHERAVAESRRLALGNRW